MPKTLVNRLLFSARRILFDEELMENPVQELDMVETIEAARSDWLSAKAYFENVLDPDLVDYAIYSMEASERKYMYLLKQAKSLGVVSNGPLTTDTYRVTYD